MDTKAAFEKWLKEKMPNLYHMAFIAEEDEMTNNFKASVFDMRTAWEGAWQASREAIDIELPEEYHSDSWLGNGCCDDYANTKIAECRKAITSHGIRIKDK